MEFKKLVDYFARLEKTASRLAITEILADLFQKAGSQEIAQICYLSQGRLAPQYVGVDFNLAEKMMLRVLVQAYQRDRGEVQKTFKKLGDLGDTAAHYDQKEKSKPLSIGQVYDQLLAVAEEAGEGSVERKISKMARLLDDLDGQSAKFVVRIPVGRLRLGFSDLTILDALSWMLTGGKSKRTEIEAAYNIRADVGQIARAVKQKGLKGLKSLKSLKVQVGVPLMPALCQRLGTAEEIIEKMNRVAVEPKYDGTRLQIHFRRSSGLIRIFTRNLENVSQMFPDLVQAVLKEVKAKEAILDGEAIGFDPKTGRLLPFQETIKRKRKYQIGPLAKEIPLKYFCFDILYQDGKDLLKKPFSERRRILQQTLPVKKNKITVLSPQIVTDDPGELRKYHQQQVQGGLEGIVAKKWQAPYDSGRRGYTWVKLKSERGKKGAGLVDTLDCVVMGYYSGKGKRTEFGIGAFLVGVRHQGRLLTISKIGTGLTDEQWREMYRRCEKAKTIRQPKQYQVDKNLVPDIWCRPKIVVEIEADNITKSPIHTAQYALRFPRLMRFRDDKSVSRATTLQETKKLYKLQK